MHAADQHNVPAPGAGNIVCDHRAQHLLAVPLDPGGCVLLAVSLKTLVEVAYAVAEQTAAVQVQAGVRIPGHEPAENRQRLPRIAESRQPGRLPRVMGFLKATEERDEVVI